MAIFLLPLSPIFNLKKDGQLALGVKTSEVMAATQFEKDFKTTISLDPRNSDNLTSGSADLSFILESTRDGAYIEYAQERYQHANGSEGFIYEISSSKNFDVDVTTSTPSWEELGYDSKLVFGTLGPTHVPIIGTIVDNAGGKILINKTFGYLSPSTSYYVRVALKDGNGNKITIPQIFSFTTLKKGEGSTPKGDSEALNPTKYQFDCGIIMKGSISGCIAELTYFVWTVAAWIARVAGSFLDYFIYYSTDSSSYVNGFINKGWGAIRDVANIFFIVALLYVAIKTILSLNVTNNKKIIGTIIVIALLINFSLFFTQVIIDGSNILAKVFYNNIESKNENGTPAIEAGGQKSVSVGLVDKFNPQSIMTQDVYNKSHGRFVFVTMLAIAIVLYTAYIFFSIALLFVSRVVMLWLSMIFAPIAFASYTLPFDIPGLGHKEWWKNLFENAFLAPIFIFFLYIIVMFTGFLSELGKYPSGDSLIQGIMFVVIPFAILAILLMKAKEMAIQYSGEMGKAFNKAGAMIAGAVGGAAIGYGIGGMAALGQKTLGRASGAIGRKISGDTAVGRFWKNRFNDASKSSFSIAAIPGAGKVLSKVGVKDAKPKYANYEERVKAKDKKRKERSDERAKVVSRKEDMKVKETEAKLATAKGHANDANRSDSKASAQFIDFDDGGKIKTKTLGITEIETAIKKIDISLGKKEKELADIKDRLTLAAEVAKADPSPINKDAVKDIADEYKKKLNETGGVQQLRDAKKRNGDAVTEIYKTHHVYELEDQLAIDKSNKEAVSHHAISKEAKRVENNVFNTFMVGGQRGATISANEMRSHVKAEVSKEAEGKH